MSSETIWSNNGTSPLQSSTGTNQYRSVLDQVDPEVAKMLANSNSNPMISGDNDGNSRRFSFNDGSDMDGNFFGFKKGSLSAITAPAGGYAGSNNGSNTGPQRINFGAASISGGIASRHPPQDSFLQKFSSVADATRDIELSNNLGKISLDAPSSRRTSFNNTDASNNMTPLGEVGGILGTPHGSLNENLNMPVPRTSRHQSISEKIDNYNNSSPIQAGAALSVNSDLNSNANDQTSAIRHPQAPHTFWNPATATSFTPNNSYGYFMENNGLQGAPVPPQNFNPYNRNGPSAPPISPPPFMIPSPPAQFMDPGLYNMMTYGINDDSPDGEHQEDKDNSDDAKNGDLNNRLETEQKDVSRKGHTPGIGLMNRQAGAGAGFMFQPFNPYTLYQQSSAPVGMSPVADPNSGNSLLDDGTSKNVPPTQLTRPSHAAPSNGNKRKGNPRNASSSGKGTNHIYRSPLLEEIRSNFKGKEYFLKDIYGHAVEFTKDQHGSRFIQQKLPESSDEEKEVIFNEIRDISYDLMTDVFGNYVIQKYFEHGSPIQKKILLDCMIGHIYELSLQTFGCRVVQRALEAIDLDGQIQIIEELKDYILVCAKDQNGNHVIQKSIETIPFDRIEFVLESLDNQIYHLSTHPYGCRVIQRLLEHSDAEDRKKILGELNRFIFYLIQDQYGNYVMQHTLERGNPEDREEILKIVLGSVVNFSKHKFASNVIEKCIKFGTLDQRRRILHEVMIGNEDYNVETVSDDSALALMMKDQYANYVIQKLVEGFDAKSDEKKILVVKLRQYLKQISSKNNYGKHLASVEKMIIVAETALVEAERSI